MKENNFLKANLLAVSRREYFALIICITVTLAIIFTNDTSQVSSLRAAVVDGGAAFLETVSWFRSMAEMREDVSRLRQRTTGLLLENSQLREAWLENQRLRALLNFKQRSDFEFVSARVIAKNPDKAVRSVTLDVGSADGVFKDMAVLAPTGVAGKILRTGQHSSTAQLLMDHNFRVACKVQRSRVDGILAYESGDYCLLTQVPKTSDVRRGDVIITSGYSKIFPQGLRVGVVDSTNANVLSLFMYLEVKPDVNFFRLEEVVVIKSYAKPAVDRRP